MNGKDAFRLILALPTTSTSHPLGFYDPYNTRVIPDFIAGFDDSEDEGRGMTMTVSAR